MNELFRLILDGLYQFWVTVTGGDNGNPGCKIQESIPIHIPDFGALPVIDHERHPTRVGW
jgi:hypothetical protein